MLINSDFEKLLIKHLRQFHAGLLSEFAAGHWTEELEDDLKHSLDTLIKRLFESGYLEEVQEIEI